MEGAAASHEAVALPLAFRDLASARTLDAAADEKLAPANPARVRRPPPSTSSVYGSAKISVRATLSWPNIPPLAQA
jgi:hypothetical protein